jgi:transcriptional regulator with XRE-family HTH domain
MTTTNTISWDAVRTEIFADPAVKAEYDALEAEFDVARHIIALRKATGLNQRDFADRVGIKQPQLARIESGKQIPKLETLMKLAAGAGYAIEVHFVPADQSLVPEIDPLHIPSKRLMPV